MSKRRKASSTQDAPDQTRRLALTQAEHQLLDQLRQACSAVGSPARKTDLLRAAIALLGIEPLANLALARAALAPTKRR